MNDDQVLELTAKMEETLGKDDFATISDTVGEILSGNAENMKTIAELNEKIEKLNKRNEKLVEANGALLQKIPAGYEEKERKPVQTDEISPKLPPLKSAFDSKGNFIK